MSREYPQFRLRVSPELKSRIEQHAKMNKRTLNAELNYLIEVALNELAPTAGTVEAEKVTNKSKDVSHD